MTELEGGAASDISTYLPTAHERRAPYEFPVKYRGLHVINCYLYICENKECNVNIITITHHAARGKAWSGWSDDHPDF